MSSKKHYKKYIKPIYMLSILAGTIMCLLIGCEKKDLNIESVQKKQISEESDGTEENENNLDKEINKIEKSDILEENDVMNIEELANQQIEDIKAKLGVISNIEFQDLQTVEDGLTGYVLCDIDNNEKEELIISYVTTEFEENSSGAEKFVWVALYQLNNEKFELQYKKQVAELGYCDSVEVRFMFNIHSKCFSVLTTSQAVDAYTGGQSFTINLYNLSIENCEIGKKWKWDSFVNGWEALDGIAEKMQQVGVSHMNYSYFNYETETKYPEFYLYASEVYVEGEESQTRKYTLRILGIDELRKKNGGYIYPIEDFIIKEIAEHTKEKNEKEAVQNIDLRTYVYEGNVAEELGGNLLEVLINDLYCEELELVTGDDGLFSYHATQPAIKVGASMNNDGYMVELTEPVDGFWIYGVEPQMTEEEITAILESKHIVKDESATYEIDNMEHAQYPIDDERYLSITYLNGIATKVCFNHYLRISYEEYLGE